MLFNHFNLHYTLNRELTELYASIGLRNFSIGLIGIFEPIYIFLYFEKNIAPTLLFFGAISVLHGLLSPFSGKMITKIGVKHSMLASSPFIFLYFLGLWKIELLGDFFIVLVPVAVIHSLLYWTAFHIDFSKFSETARLGRQLSYRHTVAALSAAASPFVGGVIITQAGYPVLFGIVLILLFVSMFPLFLSKDEHERYTDSFQKAFGEMFQKKYKNKVIAFFAEGGEGVAQTVVWPIFLFVIAVSYSAIGAISSLAFLGGVVFALFMGRVIDKMGSARILILGSLMNALTWPVKMFVTIPIDAFLVNTLHHLTRLVVLLPFGALFYDWSSRDDVNRDRFIIMREMAVNTGKGVAMIGLAAIFLFADNIAIAFPIAGVFSLMLMFFTKGLPSLKLRRGKGGENAK